MKYICRQNSITSLFLVISTTSRFMCDLCPPINRNIDCSGTANLRKSFHPFDKQLTIYVPRLTLPIKGIVRTLKVYALPGYALGYVSGPCFVPCFTLPLTRSLSVFQGTLKPFAAFDTAVTWETASTAETMSSSLHCSLEPRLSVLDFVLQLWRKIGRKAWKDFSRDQWHRRHSSTLQTPKMS